MIDSNKKASLLTKIYKSHKPEEIMSVGGTDNHAKLKGYRYANEKFEHLPGEPISETEYETALKDLEK